MIAQIFYASLDSTQLEYDRLVGFAGGNDRFLVVADRQSEGRGRDGSPWHSPSGGLWLTLDLLHAGQIPSISLYIGFCLHQLLQSLFHLPELRIKWPNDILLQGRKLAGIICRHKGSRYIAGIGINTNPAPDPTLSQLGAAILSESLGFPVSNALLAALIARRLESCSPLLAKPQCYLDYCGSQLWGRGEMVSALLPGGESCSGVISGLGSDGSLTLTTAAGQQRQLYFGQVQAIGPH